MGACFINFKFIFIVLFLLVCANSLKTCKDTFCGRVRKSPEGYPLYSLDLQTVHISDGTVTGDLVSNPPSVALTFTLQALAGSIFHLVIDEANSNTTRFRAKKALDNKNLPMTVPLKEIERTPESITVGYETLQAMINAQPFRINFINEYRLVSTANFRNRLVFEVDANNQKTAVGLEIAFPVADGRAYGLPQHSEWLALRSTVVNDGEPYRLFNIYNSNYEIGSREALFGSEPILYFHSTSLTAGVFWLNAAQTWVDLDMSSRSMRFASFMSESGVLEMFILTGGTFAQVVKQYAKLTGSTPLPPYFALGYHQQKDFYDQDIVISAVKEFDENNFPVDAVWLGYYYTDDRKYFTWNPERYSDPEGLQTNLSKTHRKLVAVVDPQIKVDDNYFLHKEASEKGYYVRNSHGTDYISECFPGCSGHLDFLNPKVLNYYASLYSVNHFYSKNINVWHKMNEPYVYNDGIEYENTIPSYSLHYGNWRHLDVHNMYSFYQTTATYKGLLTRSSNVRPFISTRSHFSGIQRYAAVWTEVDRSTWEYLRISLSMSLTMALAGVSFYGVGIGGFAEIPDEQLYQRWYQTGAWLSLYWGTFLVHEYPKNGQLQIRTALQQRYAHLPVWYTLFREHELTGEPVIRPVTYHYPREYAAINMDDEFLVGEDILVAPVLEADVTTRRVYLPGGQSQIWYNIDENYEILRGTGYLTLNITINSVPVFYRGGSIITRKNQARPTTVDTYQDPFTLYICLDDENKAQGSLYVDDYESFAYRKNEYIYVGLTFASTFDYYTLSSQNLQPDVIYYGAANITEAIVLKPPKNIKSAIFFEENVCKGYPVKISYTEDKNVLNIFDFYARLEGPFTIELYFL